MVPQITSLIIALLSFDPAASGRALSQPEARGGALEQLLGLNRLDLEAARRAGLGTVTAAVAADRAVPFVDRVRAVRAAAVLRGDPVPGLLAPLLSAAETPEDVALSREAARALYQLRAADALAPALASADPEVRAFGARAGAEPAGLCALATDDPWVEVRVAAADGLAGHPSVAGCLTQVLSDRHPKVQLAAARSASKARVPALREPLRRMAGDARASLPARAEAFVALGHLGDTEPARKALAVHLDKGGIEPLAQAAIRALTVAGEDREPIRRALGSKSPVVRITAARALVELGDRASLPAIRELRDGAHPRQRATFDDLVRRLAPAAELGGDPFDAPDDPETL